jgi:hypothetical protein
MRRYVPEEKIEQIYELCRKLASPPGPLDLDALVAGVPTDSPLWRDEGEDDKGEPN